MQRKALKIKMVSVEKQKQSKLPQDLQHRPHTQFAVGSDVEVSSDEEGFSGAWFPAEVLSPPSKAHKNRYLVEYKSLLSDDNGSEPLTEYVDPSFVRPPLPVEEGNEDPFEINDIVEAYHCDGWWTGIVTEVLGERNYRVFFQNPPDEIEFERSSLRLHKDWVDGKWVRPEEQANQGMNELMLNPGTAIEVNLDTQNSPDIWYPGTVVKEVGKRYFLVEYRSSDQTKLSKAVVNYHHIRPSPPRCNNNVFQLLDKVDAFYNFGWSNGIITKVLADGRYIVFFKRTRKEKELSHMDLRVPMSQIDGRWVHSLQDAKATSTTLEHSDANIKDDGKSTLPPENAGGVKGSGEELRNCQEEQAAPSVKPCLDTRGIAKNHSLCGRSFKNLNEEAPPEVQIPPQVFGTETTLPEEQNDQLPASLEIPTSNAEGDAFMEQSASPGRKLEAQGEKDFQKPKRTPFRGRRGRGRKRTRGSVFRSPRTSVAVQGASQQSVERGRDKLEEKNALDHAENNGVSVNAINGGNPDLRAEGTTLKRKRGRPHGSLSAPGKIKKDKTNEKVQIDDGTRRRSTRERRAVYESAMRTLKPRGKKLRMTTEILSSTQESKGNPKQKAEAVLTERATKNLESVSHEASGNVSDDDRPLSSWFGEAHSPPAMDGTEANSAENVCQSTETEARDHMVEQTLDRNDIATGGTDMDAAQYANQSEDDTGQRAGERVRDPAAKGLPFTKTSPIWKMIESMDVFQQIPQNPHFQSLYEFKEHCREGLAIGSMVTFSSLVEKISELQLSDPKSILEGSMETLSDLERQGFSVEPIRGRIKDLLSIKSNHEHSHIISEEMESQIAERERKKVRLDEEINEIDKTIAELTQKRELAVSQRKTTDSEIGVLQFRIDSMKEGLVGARAEFERLATAPW